MNGLEVQRQSVGVVCVNFVDEWVDGADAVRSGGLRESCGVKRLDLGS